MGIIIESFKSLLTMDVFIALMVGVIGGMVIGALPGFTASMGVTLLLPVTFGMEAIPALVMLTALYTSAIYGGSITAILIHTPGTPSSAATADDGFALTQQGHGLQALGVSTICSGLGGFVSGIMLLLIAPPLAKLSLMFGPAEYFLVAIFGLTVIGSLCTGGVSKGLLSAAIGLCISCIGMDEQMGFPRYTFGNVNLIGGLASIPVLIGLFSISQVMIMAEDVKDADTKLVNEAINNLKGKILLPAKEMAALIIPTLRSSIIGTIVGILPGAGGDIGSYVSYNVGKQTSKHPELYGKGSYEGIACSEAANNAVTGGSLIPLITLSVPGSATAAILLGGFLMHGLVPGNLMFTEQAGITYPIIIGFTILNILLAILGLFIARYVAKITTISISLLAPTIVVLGVLGSYAVNLSMFDVFVMAFFGFFGYIMRKTDLTVAPIVLAIILGPIAEKNLVRSFVVAKSMPIVSYYLSRPINKILLVLIAISIVIPIINSYRYKNKALKLSEANSSCEADLD